MKNHSSLIVQKKSDFLLIIAALLVFSAESTSQTISVGDSIIRALSGAASPVIKLWPTLPAPGDISGETGAERIRDTLKGKIRITDVTDPTITIIRPKQNNKGIGVIIAPGGGYKYVVVDNEGVDIAKRFNQDGITGIVLKYRCPTRTGVANYLAPLQDAQRAIAIVKKRAGEWGLDSGKIGFCGFSAGGNLGAALAANFSVKAYAARDSFDQISSRPGFVMLIYPAYLNDTAAYLSSIYSATAPAVFMCIGSSDDHYTGYKTYAAMLTSKKITFESHVYSNMEHGSGLLGPDWPTEAVRLLNKLNPTVAIAVLRSPAVLPGIDTSYKKSVGSMTSVHVEDMYDLLGRNARNAPAAVQTYGIRVIK